MTSPHHRNAYPKPDVEDDEEGPREVGLIRHIPSDCAGALATSSSRADWLVHNYNDDSVKSIRLCLV